jgi:signal transduction histidine kinase
VQWAEQHNLPAVRAAVTVSTWVWTGVFGAGIVLLAGLAPHVRDFFELRAVPALAVLAVVCTTSIVGVLVTNAASPTTRGVATIVGNSLTMWFVASLVTLSSARGATVFALLPVFVAAYHGYLLRMGTRYPFVIASTAVGMCGALALDSHHAPLFALIAPLAVGISLTLGNVALRTDELRAEAQGLRDAVAAQVLKEKSVEAQQLSTALLDVLGQNHDIGNALAAARVNTDWLHRRTTEGTPGPPYPEIHTMAAEVRTSLERLTRILQESRRIGKEMGSVGALHEVNAVGAIERVVASVDQRFHATIRTETTLDVGVHVLMRGGVTNFERVLENLLVNAWEGDGERGATEVVVRASEGPDGFVTIEIVDNGPGFLSVVLRQAVTAFVTAKHDGQGLGLYTAERLVAASGGELVRANRQSGGALVRITLAKGSAP